MLHARSDYQRFQDPAGKIGEDEPVMLFRAQDKFMPVVLAFYYGLLVSDDGTNSDIRAAVLSHIKAVNHWQGKNGCKTPDVPQSSS
jgi:hypothetical protein